MPSWLVGCQSLDDVDWDLGCENQPSGVQIVIKNNIVEMEIDFIGTVNEVRRLDTEDSGELAGVDWAISFLADIARSNGITLSAERLVEGLN